MKTKRHFAASILVTVVLFNASSCFEKPGEGKKAKKGYEACAPVIVALDSFYKINNSYPDSLQLLIPHYISALPKQVNAYALGYTMVDSGNSFSLGFNYTGPGVNKCIYTPEKKWSCSGHY